MSKIKGYEPLAPEQVAIINALKDNFAKVEEMLNELNSVDDFPIDKRAIGIAKTNLQTASMWAVRSVAQPN